MKVYHLSSCPFNGGAARAAFRLHEGLLQTDEVESLWLDSGSAPDRPDIHQLAAKGRGFLKRIRGRIERAGFAGFLQTGSITPKSSPVGWGSQAMFQDLPKPDVWNLHWVSWLMEWNELLPWMASQAPIVWTLHDLNPLKGIWHYDPVESENSRAANDKERKAIEYKRQAISKIPQDRITFVGPSKWMADRCRNSEITSKFEALNIPYGLDTETFSPRDPGPLRDMFDIPNDAFVLGFVADLIDDPRKGIEPLLSAISQLPTSQKIHLVTVGRQPPPTNNNFAWTHLGPLQNDQLMAFFYSTCNLFACPSLQDNLPNTVLESMACGTPVVGFDTGGIPDMVREDVSGETASPVGNADALAKSISSFVLNPEKLTIQSAACRQLALKEYSLSNQASRYLQLYQRLGK